jgi:hypothetical protein
MHVKYFHFTGTSSIGGTSRACQITMRGAGAESVPERIAGPKGVWGAAEGLRTEQADWARGQEGARSAK